jgi:hypothetical protein
MGQSSRSRELIMSNLVFLRRSYEYRYAAAMALRQARATPLGPERTKARVLARGLIELARTEAWLEGQRSRRGAGRLDDARRSHSQ